MKSTVPQELEAYTSGPEAIREISATSVAVARPLKSGQLDVAVFFVDLFCLGVKDSYRRRMSLEEWRDHLLPKLRDAHQDFRQVSPAYARKLIEGAVAYALGLGFAPRGDYAKAIRLLANADPRECQETFVYGSKGKPFYIQGPYDTPAFVGMVLRKLRQRCGDNFEYMIRVDEFGNLDL